MVTKEACIPVRWLQLDETTARSRPSLAKVDKYNYIFQPGSAEIFLGSKILVVYFSSIFFETENVESVNVKITDAAAGLRADVTKDVQDDVCLNI